MKIHKLTLKESEIIEVGGEYEQRFINEKTYPVFLTNYAFKKGKEQGLVESSLFTDLLKMQNLQKITQGEEIDPEMMREFNEEKMHKIIYLGLRGANRDLDMSFDEFLDRYHQTFTETLELYMNLIVGLIDKDPNKFAQGLKKSTSSKNKKKQSPQF